jgi:hypothetical protein
VLSESIVMQSREKFLCNGNSCLAHTNDSNWTCMTRYVLGLEKDLVNQRQLSQHELHVMHLCDSKNDSIKCTVQGRTTQNSRSCTRAVYLV